MIIDRLPRKAVLIAADLLRAVVVLLFLLVRDPGDVWLVYVVSIVKFTLSSFFEPAREAVVPEVVARDELVTANALSGLTWAVMLAGGAALGGLVTAWLGADLSFVLDSVSFLLSAAFTWSVAVPETHLEGRTRTHPWQDLREGLSYLRGHRDVAVYVLSKAMWSLGGGGVLVLLPLLGKEVFPLGRDGALSMGLLYAARGVGAGIGPLLAQRAGGSSERFLRRALGPSFLLMALGYLLLSEAPSLALAAAALALRALRRQHAMGLQHGAAADERAGTAAGAGVRHGADAADAGDVPVELRRGGGDRRRLAAAHLDGDDGAAVRGTGGGAAVPAVAGAGRRDESGVARHTPVCGQYVAGSSFRSRRAWKQCCVFASRWFPPGGFNDARSGNSSQAGSILTAPPLAVPLPSHPRSRPDAERIARALPGSGAGGFHSRSCSSAVSSPRIFLRISSARFRFISPHSGVR